MKNPKRRDFLKWTLGSLLVSSVSGSGKAHRLLATAAGAPPKDRLLLPISFARIQMDGDLKRRVNRNFDRLEEEKYQPGKVYITGQPDIDWPGDTEGRTLLGLTLDAQAAHRSPKYLAEIIALFPQKANSLGYLGQIEPKGVFSEQQLASHGWVLRGLCEYYLWQKDAKVLGYIRNIVNNLALPTQGYHKEYPIDPAKRTHEGGYGGKEKDQVVQHWKLSSDTGATYIFLDGLTQAYTLVPSAPLKAVIEEMISRFLEIDLITIKAQTHATLTALRALLRYYETTGGAPLLGAVQERYEQYRSQGMSENYENYNWFGRPEWTEPCAVVDSFIVATQLWRFTGKPGYLEDAHHIYFNGLELEQRANGGFGLQSCSGAKDAFVKVAVDEAHWCCTMRGGEGMSRAVQYAFFSDEQTSAVVPFYHNCQVSLAFGKGTLSVREETAYPYEGRVRFTVTESTLPFAPELRLAAPSWTADHALRVNGKAIDFGREEGFVAATLPLRKGDVLEFTFALRSGSRPAANPNTLAGYHRFYYGPLVLAYEGDTEITLPEQSQLVREGKDTFRVQGQNVVLRPLTHLMNPQVSEAGKFKRQILFKNA
ncbi:MAG TPA: hypothetical protein VF646_16700 [Cytophagales bacterium]|jgi:hypothetical protein